MSDWIRKKPWARVVDAEQRLHASARRQLLEHVQCSGSSSTALLRQLFERAKRNAGVVVASSTAAASRAPPPTPTRGKGFPLPCKSELPTQAGRRSPILADGRIRCSSPWTILSSMLVVNFHVEVSQCSIGKKKKDETERKGKKMKRNEGKEKTEAHISDGEPVLPFKP